MSEPTADWTWQSLAAARSVTSVSAEHLARIRRSVACWDTAEHGAARLMDHKLGEIDEKAEQDFQAALEVFMTSAEPPCFEGLIRNPYARANVDGEALLEGTPDPDVAALLLSRQDIELRATPEEVALWAAANLGACGINPKRPFGSTNVSRDVRAIVDPDKRLSSVTFTRRRKHLEARMLLLLQFFVQQACLEPGAYHRGDDRRWRVLPADEAYGEVLTRRQWAQRMFRQMHFECEDYAETLRCLVHLVWNNRLSGGYAALTEQFRLADYFDGRDRPLHEDRAEYEGSAEGRLRAALRHFPERKGATHEPWFTLSLARMLNGQARFAEARAALEASGFYDVAPDEVDLSTVNPTGVAFLEGIVTRRGLDVLTQDEFQSLLDGRHSGWRTEPHVRGFTWGVLHEAERFDDTAYLLSMAHAKAVAAQIELMRGGYDPDYQSKEF